MREAASLVFFVQPRLRREYSKTDHHAGGRSCTRGATGACFSWGQGRGRHPGHQSTRSAGLQDRRDWYSRLGSQGKGILALIGTYLLVVSSSNSSGPPNRQRASRHNRDYTLEIYIRTSRQICTSPLGQQAPLLQQRRAIGLCPPTT